MSEGERRALSGLSACPGVVVATAHVYAPRAADIVRRRLALSEVDGECRRFERAFDAAHAEVQNVHAQVSGESSAEYASLLAPHVALQGDPMLRDAALARIRDRRQGAEAAVHDAAYALAAPLRAAESDYLRERAEDFMHVAAHVVAHLGGTPAAFSIAADDRVLVAPDLSPAEAATLVGSGVRGIVLERGSSTSHTALLARALGIPALVGARGAVAAIVEGDVVVLDALRGEVIVGAADVERRDAEARGVAHEGFVAALPARDARVQTSDGVAIEIALNVELAAELDGADPGHAGVGLYRTEFLYLDRSVPPTEDELFAAFDAMQASLDGRPLVIRTFDLGGDKLSRMRAAPPGPNPALGLGGVRLSLSLPALFDAQLRAALRASRRGPVRLMFPRVTDLGELRAAKARAEAVRVALIDAGQPPGEVPIGTMIEVPAAVACAGSLARESDFFSVGTNDLVQYALAVDRSDPAVAHLARPEHPAVLRMLAQTLDAAAAADIPCSLCGAMASDPRVIPLAIGLGFRQLSVPPRAQRLVQETVARLEQKAAAALAREALEATTADEVAALVESRMREALGGLWSP